MKNIFPKTKEEIDKYFKKEDKTAYELIVCKCFDCCAYNPLCCKSLNNDDFNEAVNSIKYCEIGTCVLAGYARGKKKLPENKRKSRNLTPEQRAEIAERLRKGRMKNK